MYHPEANTIKVLNYGRVMAFTVVRSGYTGSVVVLGVACAE